MMQNARMHRNGVDPASRLSIRECLRGGRIGILALVKFLRSFLISDWKLEDYPVRIQYYNSESALPKGRLKPVAWYASIFGWRLAGTGETREEAMATLRKHFDSWKADRPMPRPGTIRPIEFASTAKIETHRHLMDEFAVKVLGFKSGGEIFVSDESSLWDFHTEESNERYIQTIKDVYGVNVSDLSEKGNIAEILERIASAS